MIELIFRGLFVVVSVAVASLYAFKVFIESGNDVIAAILSALVISCGIVAIDVLTPKKKLSAVSSIFFGLVVGMCAAYGMSFLVTYVHVLFPSIPDDLIEGINVLIGVVCVFISITLILQTKDDFRFVIPYVEFARDVRGNRPLVLDTSAIIDGRIVEVSKTHIIQGEMVVPKFVIEELQTIADSENGIKRARGRRGLDIVSKLQRSNELDISIRDLEGDGISVDQKLVSVCLEMNGRLVTTDYNLTKVAELRGVDVVNMNELTNAMRPAAIPGEEMGVEIIKRGEGVSQGVGYLEDGTMVVVENTSEMVGEKVVLEVTSSLQTSAGRMIFGTYQGNAGNRKKREDTDNSGGETRK